MEHKNSSSSTAALVALVFYCYIQRNKQNLDPGYKKFVLSTLESRSRFFRFLGSLYKYNLDFPVTVLEKLTFDGFVDHVGARKELIAEILQKEMTSGTTQCVIMGGGFDFLGLWSAKENPGLKVFELDHPLTQERKKDFASLVPSNFKLIPCDFKKYLITDVLEQNGWSSDIPTLFIWEGVTMYLTESDVVRTLDALSKRSVLSRLLFTFMNKRSDGNIQFFGAPSWTKSVLLKKREPFTWGIESSKIENFLKQHGWALQKLWTHEENSKLIFDSEVLAYSVTSSSARTKR